MTGHALSREALDKALLAAHAAGDTDALVHLYTCAADLAESHSETDASCFFLTQAFVFALEVGHPQARVLNARLAEQGRSQPLPL